MNANPAKVLDRVRKLMALSQSSNEHEAAAALARAQALMAEHSLTTSQLLDITHLHIRSRAATSRAKPYEVNLICMVAKSFGCCALFVRGRSSANPSSWAQFTLVGPRAQVEVATYTAEVLMRRMMKARAKFVDGLTMHRRDKTVEADGFCVGWALQVSQLVVAFAQPDQVKQAMKAYAITELGSKGSIAKTQKLRLGDLGYAAGREAAAGETLHRPMGTTKQGALT